MVNSGTIKAIFKREFKSYFESPVAYVFMVVFLLFIGFMTFSFSNFYERQTADLQPFFMWIPWVFLLLIPASCMGLWADERRSGTIELLLTMPITMTEAILGKFLAAWAFIVIGVAMTFPIIITTCFLGSPDMGAVISGYAGSVLMAGAYVSIGMLTSSMTRSQVIGFVLALVFCFILIIIGWPPVTNYLTNWAPAWLIDAVAAFSLMTHYEAMQRGVIDLIDVTYYLSVMVFFLTATHVVVDSRKSS